MFKSKWMNNWNTNRNIEDQKSQHVQQWFIIQRHNTIQKDFFPYSISLLDCKCKAYTLPFWSHNQASFDMFYDTSMDFYISFWKIESCLVRRNIVKSFRYPLKECPWGPMQHSNNTWPHIWLLKHSLGSEFLDLLP